VHVHVHVGTSPPPPRPPRPQASRTSAHGRTAHQSSSTAQSATAASLTVRVPCTCVLECLFPPVHPSFRPCRVASFVRACVRVDVRHSPPPPHPRAVWSLGCLLCDVLLRGSMLKPNGPPLFSPIGIDLRASQLATPGPLECATPGQPQLWAILRTLRRRGGASPPPHGSSPWTSYHIGAASSFSMPRGSTATRCCAKRRRTPRAPRSFTCCTAASAHQRSKWAWNMRCT
jgi:hypothetical protein